MALVSESAVPQLPADVAERVQFDKRGLVPVVVQDAGDRTVLMMAWANAEALARTLARSEGTYWSRSRQELWVKGATSGHTQAVREVRIDCDGDTLLYLVDQVGPACHTGTRSCFDQTLLDQAGDRPGDQAEGEPAEDQGGEGTR